MRGGTIATGTGGQIAQKVDMREKLNVVAGTHGACLHKVLSGVARETCAHEDVQHIMHQWLCLGARDAQMVRKGARQV